MIIVKRTNDKARRKTITPDELLESTSMHIGDVNSGLKFFSDKLLEAGENHDCTKVTRLEDFHSAFKNNWKDPEWYDFHMENERHHLTEEKGIPSDVNLLDVLEHF